MTLEDWSTGHRITRFDPPSARGVVLLLHGGKPASTQLVDGRSASWRRMAAVQRALAPAAMDAGVATWLLRYRERGWNGGAPVADARAALDDVRAAHGEVPVVLLGHSMGARVAVHLAAGLLGDGARDEPGGGVLAGVVGLAPWWSPDDPVDGLEDLPVVAAHGRSDKITSARATRAFLQRARAAGARTEYVDMGRVGHYLLRRVPRWNDVATRAALAPLLHP